MALDIGTVATLGIGATVVAGVIGTLANVFLNQQALQAVQGTNTVMTVDNAQDDGKE